MAVTFAERSSGSVCLQSTSEKRQRSNTLFSTLVSNQSIISSKFRSVLHSHSVCPNKEAVLIMSDFGRRDLFQFLLIQAYHKSDGVLVGHRVSIEHSVVDLSGNDLEEVPVDIVA